MIYQFRSIMTDRPERKDVTADLERGKKLRVEADFRARIEKSQQAEEAVVAQR